MKVAMRDLNKPAQIEAQVNTLIARRSPRDMARKVSGTVAMAAIGLADAVSAKAGWRGSRSSFA